MKLNQTIAIEKGLKSKAQTALETAYHSAQKPQLFNGLTRVYTPKDDDGDKYPNEGSVVQQSSHSLIESITTALSEYYNIVATKDIANTQATANIIVDGKIIATAVPVTQLLFLEKRLVELKTFVQSIPVLDPTEKWTFEATRSQWVSEPTITFKTKKIPKSFVKSPATDKHPAQVEVFQEDVVVGTWTATKQSGAINPSEQKVLFDRIEKLTRAVKIAREEANATTAIPSFIGTDIINFVFGL